MRKFALGLVVVASSLFLCIWVSDSSRTAAKPSVSCNAPNAFHGNWAVVGHAICGTSDTEFVGATLSIAASPEVNITHANGCSQWIEFQCPMPEVEGAYQLLVSNGEDSPEMGGGGLRKAIVRLDQNGDLDLVEATNSDDDYPANFSQATKNISIHWKIARVIE